MKLSEKPYEPPTIPKNRGTTATETNHSFRGTEEPNPAGD